MMPNRCLNIELFGEPRRAIQSLAAAISSQSDLSVRYVGEEPPDSTLGSADARVDMTAGRTRISHFRDDASRDSASLLFPPETRSSMKVVPHPDILAICRVFKSLRRTYELRRVTATIIRRPSPETKEHGALTDGLTPLDVGESFLSDLHATLGDSNVTAQIAAVAAPITHFHLLMLRLTSRSAIEREQVIETLKCDPRIMMGRVEDGFRTTADVAEFFRDLNRPRGDQWELFVWTESVMTDREELFLTAGYSPDAVGIPEILDAIGQLADPQADLRAVQDGTDRELQRLGNLVETHDG